jgi:hypothetical protein
MMIASQVLVPTFRACPELSEWVGRFYSRIGADLKVSALEYLHF